MQELFQQSGPLALLVVGGVILYMIISLRIVRRDARKLWIPALVVAVLATMLYWDAFGSIGVTNWFTRLSLSIVTALDLFLFKALSSLGLAPYFYAAAASTTAGKLMAPVHLVLLYGLFLCAIWTTSILTVHLFARRFSSRLWLIFHKPSGRKTHLFFGDTPQSVALAADLAKKRDEDILFVVFPSQEALPSKLSFLQMLRGSTFGGSHYRRIRDAVPSASILSARTALRNAEGPDLFAGLGLDRLGRWAQDPSTSIYLLSEDLAENLFALQSLPEGPARIFCRAERSGLNDSIELSSRKQITFIDMAYMTVKQMKMDPAFHPVRFVPRAFDADGQPLGWVTSPFRAMVLGYGETGQGAVEFLYEFGALVGEDKEQVPFLCEVIDRDAASRGGTFRTQHAGIPQDRIRFLSMEVGSDAFWEHFTAALPTLNYVTVSLGDDQQNVQLALELLELFCRSGLKMLPALIVKLEEPEKYRGMLDFYTSSLQADCVRILGGQGVWTVENIIDDTFEKYARLFYESYGRTTGGTLSWDERLAAIQATDKSPLWKKREARRKMGQDYSDYFHMRVKAALCPERFWKDPAVAESIPTDFKGIHSSDASAVNGLEYLAIGEHLRWQAAHEISGYQRGDQKREDLKVHPALVDYPSLTEMVRHYDWIVVKTTLTLLYQEYQSSQAEQSNSPAKPSA